MLLPKEQKGTVVLVVLILILVILIITFSTTIFLKINKVGDKEDPGSKSKSNYVQKSSAKSATSPSPAPTPDPWLTYANTDYGFGITYPRKGVVHQAGGAKIIGYCGGAIIDDPKDPATILVDNFYKLKIISWEGTLDNYLSNTGAKSAYNTEQIEQSGADEAVRLLGLKPDYEVAVGFPPLAYIKAVYKKGGNIFLMQEILHNPSNPGGCVVPSVVDPSKFVEIAKLDWDITKSIRFVD